MKITLVFLGICIAVVLGLHTVLSNGALMNYLDTHADARFTPPIDYFVGEGYYLFQDLPNAATYYWRVSDRFPDSPYADDAYFNYLQCLDDMTVMPRAAMAVEYAKYLERFPHGNHVDMVQHRIEAYKSGI